MGGTPISSKVRDQVLFEANHECHYCGCLLTDDQYQPSSACINHYLTKRACERQGIRYNVKENLQAACYVCCLIKNNMDVTKYTLASLRHEINLERKRKGLSYNPEWLDQSQIRHGGAASPRAQSSHAQVQPQDSLGYAQEPSGAAHEVIIATQPSPSHATLEEGLRAFAERDAKLGLASPTPPFDPKADAEDDEQDAHELAMQRYIEDQALKNPGPIGGKFTDGRALEKPVVKQGTQVQGPVPQASESDDNKGESQGEVKPVQLEE